MTTDEPKPCEKITDHDFYLSSYGGSSMVVIYTCRKCGEEYEKDVS